MSAIHRRFVDRFVGLRVPSRVSRRWVSPHGAPLSSSGSRRARFPAFSGTTRALRLPACAFLVPYGFGPRLHLLPPMFVLAEALPVWRRTTTGPGVFGQPVSPPPASRRWARTGSLRFPGSPSHAFALFQDPGRTGRTSPLAILSMLPPVPTLRRLQRDMISGLPQGFSVRCLRFTSGVAVAHARLASGWRAAPLPGGGRTLWTAMKGFKLHPSSFPGLS